MRNNSLPQNPRIIDTQADMDLIVPGTLLCEVYNGKTSAPYRVLSVARKGFDAVDKYYVVLYWRWASMPDHVHGWQKLMKQGDAWKPCAFAGGAK